VNAERSERIVAALRERPAGEPPADALAAVFAEQYPAAAVLDRHDIERVQLVTSSPAPRGEYLKTLVQAERPLAEVIAERTGADPQRDLYPRVLAAAAFSAARAAVGHWTLTEGTESLASLVRRAVLQVVGPPT